MTQRKISASRKWQRVWRMLRDRNFFGLWHQLKHALGLWRPVPAPVMPEPTKPVHAAFVDLPSISPAIRLLVFSHDLNMEGASISLFELILELQKNGVVTPEVVAFEDGPLRGRYEASGIPISIFPCDRDKNSTIRRLEMNLLALAAVMRQRAPSLILANTLRSFLAILAAKEAGIPSVWIVRESSPWNTFFSYLPEPVAQRAIAAICLPYRVVFVSHASRGVWKQFDRYGNFEVIHNGIDLSRFPGMKGPNEKERARRELGLKDDVTVILCVGTINARKSQDDLVRAVGVLSRMIQERIEVLFVGDDESPYAIKLRQRCESSPPYIRKSIRFFSTTKSVQQFYEAADIFVLCSREESFPRVTLEAMAFGLPLVTTPVHGVVEQVVAGGNAFFYQQGDIDDLGRRIASLVQDDDLRKRMGQSSEQRFSELNDFKKMVQAFAVICGRASKTKS